MGVFNFFFLRSVQGLISRQTRGTAGSLQEWSLTLPICLPHTRWPTSIDVCVCTHMTASTNIFTCNHELWRQRRKKGAFCCLCAYLIVKCVLSSGLFSGVFLQGLSFFSYLCLTHCREPYLPSQRSHWWLCVPPAYHNQSSAAQKYLMVWVMGTGPIQGCLFQFLEEEPHTKT